MFLKNKKEAEKISLAITSEGMHFKGQYLSKESYIILGREVDFIAEAFNYVILIRYKGKEYFISKDLIK